MCFGSRITGHARELDGRPEGEMSQEPYYIELCRSTFPWVRHGVRMKTSAYVIVSLGY